jgi:hypothetical protein
MDTALSPKLLDVVEVPNKFLGYEKSGTTLGTVMEVMPSLLATFWLMLLMTAAFRNN